MARRLANKRKLKAFKKDSDDILKGAGQFVENDPLSKWKKLRPTSYTYPITAEDFTKVNQATGK